MTEPNYMAYAQYMGSRNPMAEGLNSLGGALSDIQKQRMDNEDRTRRNSLADLQLRQGNMAIQTAQDEANYKTGLRAAMQNPSSVTSIAPQAPQGNSLAGLMGNAFQVPQSPELNSQQPASPMVQAYQGGRVSTKTESPAQAGIKYAISQGKLDDAAKMVSVDDALAQYGAKIAAGGGDPQSYYQAKEALDQAKEGLALISKFSKQPEMLKTIWPLIVKSYPQAAKITPDMVQTTSKGTAVPMTTPTGEIIPNKFALYDEEGKVHVVDATPKPDTEAMLDKRLESQAKLQQTQIAAADRRAERQIAAADRRAERPKPDPPAKALPAGQLEGIADMKRVKDVLAEAGKDVEKNGVDTGPVSGRLQSLGAKVGLASDKFVSAQQKLQTAQNIMLKLRSGAAVTESEYSRFLKEYPTPNDPPEVFKTKLANTLSYANTLMDDKLNIYEEGGYKVPKSARSSNGSKPANAPGKRPPLSAIFGK